jgi:hypothetical protein
VIAVAELTPKLLTLYFDLLIAYAEEKHLREIFPLMFERMEQVCALFASTTCNKNFLFSYDYVVFFSAFPTSKLSK